MHTKLSFHTFPHLALIDFSITLKECIVSAGTADNYTIVALVII